MGVVTKLTPTGIALYASSFVALLAAVGVRVCAPESVLGAFLSTDEGVTVAFAVGLIAHVVALAILIALGHPIVREERVP